MNQPYIHFYPRDWLAEYKLRMLSPADRGVWIDILCLMAMAEPYGHLALNGKPMTDGEVCKILGIDVDTYKGCLYRLIEVGVCSKNGNGEVYSRRLVRDYERRVVGAKYGKQGGGNPLLKNRSKSISNAISISRGTIKVPYKGQFKKPEALEVEEYGKQIGFELDGQSFCDFYESKGWKVGNTAMKDWQAAVRTWKRRGSASAPASKSSRKPFPGEIMKQLDELRMQRKTLYNRYEVNGTIPADKPQAKTLHSELCAKIAQLEKELRTL